MGGKASPAGMCLLHCVSTRTKQFAPNTIDGENKEMARMDYHWETSDLWLVLS
jgi:hypothetical protein